MPLKVLFICLELLKIILYTKLIFSENQPKIVWPLQQWGTVIKNKK